MSTSRTHDSVGKKISQRWLEQKVFRAHHANLCRSLVAREIVTDLYSAGVVSEEEMDQVNAAATRLEQNKMLLQAVKNREFPVRGLCATLEKYAPFQEIAKGLKAAVEKMRREYEKRDRTRHSVSPQQVQAYRRTLTDAGMQFALLTADLATIIDRHPEALQRMQIVLITVNVMVKNEQVSTVIKSREFKEACTASDLFRALAPIITLLDDKTLETLVHASQVDEAIERFEAYQKIRDPTMPLVVHEKNTPRILLPPPASSEAAAVGAREVVVRTSHESLTMGDVEEMRENVSHSLNLPLLALSPQGVIQSSIAVVFWVSEQLVPYIQSQLISLPSLHFLHDEGIVDVKIESDYLLTIPSALYLEFWEACAHGDVETVLSCLSAGVSVDVTSRPQNQATTGLMFAALNGRDEVVHLLLASGADHNIQDIDGATALMYAAQYGHTETAEVLLGAGADVSVQNKDGQTALMYAAQDGHTETAEVLLREGADVSPQDKDGYSALHWAAQEGHTAIVSSLLRASADPNSVASWRGGTTPLMLATLGGHQETVDLLLHVEAEVNKTRRDGWTALMHAAAGGHVNVLRTLIDNKADVNMLTEDHVSALDLAKQENFTEMCELLLKHGAKPGGPGSQERAKTGLAKLWARVKKALKGPLTSSFQDLDIGGVKGRRKQKEDTKDTISPTQTSH